MKTVFWKELRENARWASLGFIAMVAALVFMWRASRLIFDGGYAGHGDNYSYHLAGMCAVFTAITLGILQTLRDNRPDSRALLLHRGITVNAAFFGKLLAGVALYAFAIFGPLLGMAIFIAINGIEHRAAAPVSLLPLAFLTLAAFGFWPAALLVVQRDARVLGSRLMPAVSALLALLPWFTPLDQPMLLLVFLSLSLLSLFALLLAARSVFVNSGQLATGIGRATLTLLVSITLLVMFMFVSSTVQSYRWKQIRASADPGALNRQYAVQIGPEGQPWLTRNDYSWQDGSYQVTRAARMASGRSVRDQLQPVAEDWQSAPGSSFDTRYHSQGRGLWNRFTSLHSASSPGSAGFVHREWVFDHRNDVILVYHGTLSGEWQLAGRLRAPEPIGSFGVVAQYGKRGTDSGFALATSTGAFYVPDDGSAVIALYQIPPSPRMLGFGDVFTGTQDKDAPFSMVLLLTDRVVLLQSDLEGRAASRATSIGEMNGVGMLFVTEILLPNELVASPWLTIARDPVRDGGFLGLAHNGKIGEYSVAYTWVRLDTNGQIVARQEYTENIEPDLVYPEPLVELAFIPPGAWAIAGTCALVVGVDASINSAWQSANEDPARAVRMALLILLQPIAGVSLAVWATRRRRLDKRQTWLCIGWGFLMGPAGSLSILAVYPRIVRDGCVSCRQATRIDLDHCEHCGHPAEDVPKMGIEIFDRDPLEASEPPISGR